MTSEYLRIGLLRNVPTRRIVHALEKDGFEYRGRQGSQRVYRHADGRRVLTHYHATDALPAYVIRNLLIGTRWTEGDLKRLRIVK